MHTVCSLYNYLTKFETKGPYSAPKVFGVIESRMDDDGRQRVRFDKGWVTAKGPTGVCDSWARPTMPWQLQLLLFTAS